MAEEVVTKIEATKTRIIRALTCAAGYHEPWERYDNHGYRHPAKVFLDIMSNDHGEVYCAVCKFCRTIYVRKRDE